jgi:hypothetical protein
MFPYKREKAEHGEIIVATSLALKTADPVQGGPLVT